MCNCFIYHVPNGARELKKDGTKAERAEHERKSLV